MNTGQSPPEMQFRMFEGLGRKSQLMSETAWLVIKLEQVTILICWPIPGPHVTEQAPKSPVTHPHAPTLQEFWVEGLVAGSHWPSPTMTPLNWQTTLRNWIPLPQTTLHWTKNKMEDFQVITRDSTIHLSIKRMRTLASSIASRTLMPCHLKGA